MTKLSNLLKDLKQLANPEKEKIFLRFFKTGKGQYGEGDLFLGLTVPQSRTIAKKYINLSFTDLDKLIKNKYHEARLVALLILVQKYKQSSFKSDLGGRKKIYHFYLAHTKYINNWDLVDLSAHYVFGDYLLDKDRKILIKLAKSKNLWERRIAMISTFAFIYKGESEWTFKIAKMLINDQEDLIHKASGWMLREVGKRVSEAKLRAFLDVYTLKIPRTMLRYAIERLPEKKRKYYLNKKSPI